MTPQETIHLEREIIASSGREPSEWIKEYGRQYRDAVEAIHRQGREPTKIAIERLLYKDGWFEQPINHEAMQS